MLSDETYMQRCLELAAKGRGRVSPNPMVGCIIICEGKVIGQGYHYLHGGPHAEVNAIASVKDRSLLKKSTLYVNLEPCAHHGKTPPCADLIVSSRIPKVVIGTEDPYPQVAGQGIGKLKAAGIDVRVDVLKTECQWLNRRFFTFNTLGRPYIILKWAESRDGFLSAGPHDPSSRESWWITGKATQVLVHEWRSNEDAILAGSGTLRQDDPQLDVRHWTGRTPLRIILDMELNLSRNLKVFSDGNPLIIINRHKEETKGHHIFKKADGGEKLIPELLKIAASIGIQSILVEGGASILSQFIARGSWDEARVIRGLKTFGTGIASPTLAIPPSRVSQAGEDIVSIYYNTSNQPLPVRPGLNH